MAQQDDLIDIDTFNLDVKAMSGQTIQASILVIIRDSQHLANQTVELAHSISSQFPVPSPDLEYHSAFGYYHTLNSFLHYTPAQSAPAQFFLHQTLLTLISNFLPTLSIYVPPTPDTSATSPVATPPSHISF